MRTIYHYAGSAAALALSQIVALAPAQAADTEDANDNAASNPSGQGLSEIIVTAQRRSENLQKVPIAVSTLDAVTLAAAGVASTDTLASVTPGLLMTRQLRGSVPFIRGVGAVAVSPGNESPVSTYVDGVYFMSPVGNIFSFNSVERVEVLRGPQGTLFGRNTTGGIVNIATRTPSTTPQLEGTLSYANYETYEGNLYVSGGSGNVAASLAAYINRQEKGYGVSLTTSDEVSFTNETALLGKLHWQLSDADEVTISADWSLSKGDLGLSRNVVPGSRLSGGAGFRGTIYDQQATFPARNRTEYYGASLKYRHDFGDVQFQSLTAYRKLDAVPVGDFDNAPPNFLTATLAETNRTFQQELLFTGSASRLDWTAGLFFFDARSAFDGALFQSSLVPSLNYARTAVLKTRSYAGFAQGTYALTDTTKFTAGARYTIDERSFDARHITLPAHPLGGGQLILANSNEKTFKRATWRLAIDQEIGGDALAYVSYNRGFKSGLFNTGDPSQALPGQPSRSAPADPEILDAVEIGLKSELFNRTLRLNAAAFKYWYDGIQLSRVSESGTQQLLNAASGDIKGIELEATFAPSVSLGRLELTGNVALLDADYKSFPNGFRTFLNPAGGTTSIPADLSGNRMVRAPKMTFNIGFDYRLPLAGGEVNLSGNFYHNSGFFTEPDNRLYQKEFNLVNAQIAYSFGEDGRYRVRVFGRNLLNEEYYSYLSAGGFGDSGAPAPPLTYGMAFDFKF